MVTSAFGPPAPPSFLTRMNVRKADFYETLKQMPRDKEKALEVRSIDGYLRLSSKRVVKGASRCSYH